MTRARLSVIAVGGNALISDQEHLDLDDQARQAATTAGHIARVVGAGWRTVITHGNGPQVGFILRRSEVAKDLAPEVPLAYAVADTQGAIGFMLQQGLANELRGTSVVAIVTRVGVDPEDASFQHPTKPVGAQLSEADAKEMSERFGWAIVEDAGRGWRRVVASPPPLRILELDALRDLLDHGHLVVAGGGGGIPVVENGDEVVAVDAVIDKDSTSALLARELGADALMILTDVDRVAVHYRTSDQRFLDDITAEEAERLLHEGHFAEGSMAPKVRAAIMFARSAPGATAVITDAKHAYLALEGKAGTRIRHGSLPARPAIAADPVSVTG